MHHGSSLTRPFALGWTTGRWTEEPQSFSDIKLKAAASLNHLGHHHRLIYPHLHLRSCRLSQHKLGNFSKLQMAISRDKIPTVPESSMSQAHTATAQSCRPKHGTLEDQSQDFARFAKTKRSRVKHGQVRTPVDQWMEVGPSSLTPYH